MKKKAKVKSRTKPTESYITVPYGNGKMHGTKKTYPDKIVREVWTEYHTPPDGYKWVSRELSGGGSYYLITFKKVTKRKVK